MGGEGKGRGAVERVHEGGFLGLTHTTRNSCVN